MIWDTALSPRVLLETEEPSLDQSPSNHGQTMEGRGSDLRILLHQCLSHSVWRWPQYHQLTTHTQHEAGRRNNGTSKPVGMSCFLRFWTIPSISPVFLWNVSSVIVIVISTHNCRSVSLSGIGYVMCKVIYRFHGLPIDNPIGQVFDSPFATKVWWRGTMGWLPHSELYGFVAIAIQFIIRVPM